MIPFTAIHLQTVASWSTVLVALFIAWRISKGGGGSAVSELSKANEVLEKRIHELGAEVRDLRVENTALKARTDFNAVMQLHEERAAARSEKILVVLNMIAEKIGGNEQLA